jgi:Outer membrane protein beta-barrel domain
MKTRFLFTSVFAALLIALLSHHARSQSGQLKESATPKVEATAVFTYLRLRDVGEGPGGIGGRFTYNLKDYLALEAEATHFPENPSGNFGETTGFFGVKAGKRWFDKFGLFGKVKPGFIAFKGDFSALRTSKKGYFAMDVGGVIEIYPSRHTVVRLDYSDVIIPFGDATYIDVFGAPKRLGTSHNLQQSFSIGVRF